MLVSIAAAFHLAWLLMTNLEMHFFLLLLLVLLVDTDFSRIALN